MEILRLIDSIKKALKSDTILAIRPEELCPAFQSLYRKITHASEWQITEFLISLQEILVFGGYLNKYEAYIEDFGKLDYRETKTRVQAFVMDYLTRCEFLPVQHHLLHKLVLKLINGEITAELVVAISMAFRFEVFW